MINTRYTPLWLGALLPLLLFGLFVPKGVVQMDLLLLWLLAMVFAGLPLMFAELGLAYRSQNAPMSGMQTLTRQSDAKRGWRVFAWGSVLLAMLLGAALIHRASVMVLPLLPTNFAINGQALVFALSGLGLILSLAKERLLPLAAVIAVIAVLWSLANSSVDVAMTTTNRHEWAQAVVMAALSVGAGTGLYWFLAKEVHTLARPLRALVLPIWAVQLGAGALALFAVTSAVGALALPALLAAAFLWYYAGSQLATQLGVIKASVITVVAVLLFGLLPTGFFVPLLFAFALVLALILALFCGFVVKISHLRKSLNFSSEAVYNVWRVGIRWLAPLALVVALVGFWL